MKVETVDFQSFIRNDRKESNLNHLKLIGIGTASNMVMTPAIALAASTEDSFMTIFSAVMGIVDWVAAGIFVFAGLTYMFGKQTKGIELIVCGATGYLLARHAVDVRDFLKAL